VNTKAGLAKRYIPRALGHVKMRVYTCAWEGKLYTGTAYHPINLLYFKQKTMKKVVARNMKDKTLGHVPYNYNNIPTIHGIPHKLQCTM
jgi:hypothetical protein